MVIKISTDEGWVYYDDIVSIEVCHVRCRMEEGDDKTGIHPQFYTMAEETIPSPDNIHLATLTDRREPTAFRHAFHVKCILTEGGSMRIGFDGRAYLLNNEGKTVEHIHH